MISFFYLTRPEKNLKPLLVTHVAEVDEGDHPSQTSSQAGFFTSQPSPLKDQVTKALSKIQTNYGDGPHKDKLQGLINTIDKQTAATAADFTVHIDRLTGLGGGLGYGKLNGALKELSKQISRGLSLIDSDFLGRLAADKNAKPAQGSSSLKK